MENEFQVTDDSITTEELDAMVEAMAELKADYDAKKKLSTAAHEQYQESRAKLISTLQQAGKTKYHVDSVGTVSVTEKLKIRVPKDPEDKESFFKWLNNRYGREGFLTYATVNYNSLNSLYNTEFENAKLAGTADNFEIAGVGQPEHEYGLSFRK